MTSSRYAFRSTEKVALQEIGPRFTLKLRSLKKGLPAVNYLGDVAKPLEFDEFDEPEEKADSVADDQPEPDANETARPKKVPPKADEYEWVWKVSLAVIWKVSRFVELGPKQPELETSRRTFFL
jgi:ribosome production factor 1